MNIVEKVTQATEILNEIDIYGSKLHDRLTELNNKQLDLLHFIENNKISIIWCYRVIRELKDIRVERRKVKNDIELMSKYNELKARLSGKETRQFILSELHKKEKSLQTTYKNREYTEEDIQGIITGGKHEEE